jgi:hypothetical protein
LALPFPARGRPREEIFAETRLARDLDVRWREGRVFGLVYQISDEVEDLLKEAFTLFFSENGLNPAAFPSLRKSDLPPEGRSIVSVIARQELGVLARSRLGSSSHGFAIITRPRACLARRTTTSSPPFSPDWVM